jgi:hypothetical protein
LSSRVVVEKMEKGLYLFYCLLYLLVDFPIMDGKYDASFAYVKKIYYQLLVKWLGRLTKLWLPLSFDLLYNLLCDYFYFCFICDYTSMTN